MDSRAALGARSVSRRVVLAGAVTASVAPLLACTGDDDPGPRPGAGTTRTPPPTTASPVGDVATAGRVLAEEQAILAFCATLVRRTRGEARRSLTAVRDRQQAIVTAVTDAMTDPAAARRRPFDVPRREAAMLRELTRLLAAAEEDRLTDCLAAESGAWARLLASVAASHAVAVEQVRALR